MAMSSFACAIVGWEPATHRQRPDAADAAVLAPESVQQPAADMRASRQPSRRATSYHNVFQTSCSTATDDPPSYAQACRHPRPAPRRTAHPSRDVLPTYSSTVNAEATLLVNVEAINPLHGAVESEWREVYFVLQGTLLSFHRVKDGGKGKLLRNYTLQHAEVGLAPDVHHTILVPQSRLAHFVPAAARRRAWQKDPDLFRPARQTVLRLRAETDQILLAHSSEDTIHQIIQAICAAIDISPAIDERSIPRQQTVPRRRRRVRHTGGDIADPALQAQQERMFREMYPAFAEEHAANGAELARQDTVESQAERPVTASREEDELDLAMIREDTTTSSSAPTTPSQTRGAAQRPPNPRQTTASSINSTFSDDMMHATAPENFTIDGKWQPPNHRTPAQAQRYIKRCMPVLLADATRASDVLICNGKRVRINWRMELLEEWELQPPSYKSHSFENDVEDAGAALERTASNSTTPESATEQIQQSSTSIEGQNVDAISPVDQSFGSLTLSKSNSTTKNTTTAVRRGRAARSSDAAKTRSQINADVHSVVFYF